MGLALGIYHTRVRPQFLTDMFFGKSAVAASIASAKVVQWGAGGARKAYCEMAYSIEQSHNPKR